jgi:hypothetical protein
MHRLESLCHQSIVGCALRTISGSQVQLGNL